LIAIVAMLSLETQGMRRNAMSNTFRPLVAAAAAVVCGAAPAIAVTTPGSNFDSIMSLIYDVGTGNVFLENAPLSNPAVQSITVASATGLFIPANLNVPVLSPAVTVTSNTITLVDLTWSSGNFLGTGSFLGNIMPGSLTQPFLLGDLTISYMVASGPPNQPGDLLHTAIPGSTAGNPILPSSGGNGFWRFFNVATGNFMDPPIASGYVYTIEAGAPATLFTEVGLPYGLGTNFTITSSEGTVTGLGEGDLHVFSGGVSTFTLTGINPLVDPNNPAAFPLFLEFNGATASFNMLAVVPEPATGLLATLTTIGLTTRRRRFGCQ